MASVRHSSGCPKNDAIVFGDEILDRVMRIWERCTELAFKVLQFVAVYRRCTEMADVVGGNKLVEAARKSAI